MKHRSAMSKASQPAAFSRDFSQTVTTTTQLKSSSSCNVQEPINHSAGLVEKSISIFVKETAPKTTHLSDTAQAIAEREIKNVKLSRKGKVTHKRKTGLRGSKQTGSQSKAARDIIQIIRGETPLNQSGDFKEPPCPRAPATKQRDGASRGNRKKMSKNTETTGGAASSGNCESRTKTVSYRDGLRRRTPTDSCDRSVPLGEKSSVHDCSANASELKVVSVSSSGFPGDRRPSPPPYPSGDGDVPAATGSDGVDDRLESDADSLKRCPLCDETLPGQRTESNAENNAHIQKCLRQRFATKGTAATTRDPVTGNSDDTSCDEEFARLLQRREDEKQLEETATKSELFFCQICQRELSHMNSTRRTQHINRCIDKIETIEPKGTASRKRKQMVPRHHVSDCPICSKKFNTTKQRESHLKKCARVNNVSPQELISLVRLQGTSPQQQATRSEAIRAEAVPSCSSGPSNEKNAACETDIIGGNIGRHNSKGRNATRGQSKVQKPTDGRNTLLDEETQVAMALSASLIAQPGATVPTEGAVINPATGEGLTKLQKKKRKKKLPTRYMPLLVRTEEEHRRILEQRISDLIPSQNDRFVRETPKLRRSKVARKYRQSVKTLLNDDVAPSDNQKNSSEGTPKSAAQLWGLASSSSDRTQFYIHKLLPGFITPEQAKRLSESPGERPSIRKDVDQSAERPGQERKLTPADVPTTSSVSQLRVPDPATQFTQATQSTQSLGCTVQILVDLATASDDDNDNDYPITPESRDGTSIIAASGFIPTMEDDEEVAVETVKEGARVMVMDRHQLVILDTLAGLVDNNDDLCDLHLRTSDLAVVYAHQFVIRLRCPKLAQVVDNEGSDVGGSRPLRELGLGYTRRALLSVLEYVYAGKLGAPGVEAVNVLHFAQRFALPELAEFCRVLCQDDTNTLSSKSSRDEFNSLSSSQEDKKEAPVACEPGDKDLEELLQGLWESSGGEGRSSSHSKSDQRGGGKKTRCRMSDSESDAADADDAPDEKDLDEIYDFFSTQRQKRANQSSSSDGEGDVIRMDWEEDEENEPRHSRTIVEQLQSSFCHRRPFEHRDISSESPPLISPKSQKRGDSVSPKKGDSVSQKRGDSVSSKRGDFVSPKRGDSESPKRGDSVSPKRGDSVSPKRGDSVSPKRGDSVSPKGTKPCFVDIGRLSDDLPVSPVEDDDRNILTIGACLRNFARKKPEEVIGQGENALDVDKYTDATLAEVSVFHSRVEDDMRDDVVMVDMSQDSEDGSSSGTGQQLGLEQSGVSLFGSPWSSQQDEEEARLSSRNSTLSQMAVNDETLPSVDFGERIKVGRKQDVDVGLTDDFNSDKDSDDVESEIVDENDIDDNNEDEVIDLSLEEDEEIIVSDTEPQNSNRDNRSPEAVVQMPSCKSDAVSQLRRPAAKNSPLKVSRRKQFTFRRRVTRKTPQDLERACSEAVNNTRLALITDLSTSDTPTAHRSKVTTSRDASTPLCTNQPGYQSPQLSPVKYSTDAEPEDNCGTGLSVKRFSNVRSINVPPVTSGEQYGRTAAKDRSPVLVVAGGRRTDGIDKEITDKPALEFDEDLVSLPSSPIRPTPDCFAPDTPELIISISPTPLSPSPPPSPTFGKGSTSSQRTSRFAKASSIPFVTEDTSAEAEIPNLVTRPLSPSPPPSPTFGRGSSSSQRKPKFTDASSLSFATEDTKAEVTRNKRKHPSVEDEVTPAKRSKMIASPLEGGNHLQQVGPKSLRDSQRDGFKWNYFESKEDDVSWTPVHICLGLSPTRNPSTDDVPSRIPYDDGIIFSSREEAFAPKSPSDHPPAACSPRVSPKQCLLISSDSSSTLTPHPDEDSIGSGDAWREDSPQPPTSSPDVSEEQFAYYEAEGEGFGNNDFSIGTGVEGHSQDLTHHNVTDTRREIQPGKRTGEHAISLKNRSPSKPSNTSKAASSISKHGRHGNVSIRSFSSSSESGETDSHRLLEETREAPPIPPGVLSGGANPEAAVSLPRSATPTGADALSQSALLLRDEAEEFGCSESFLRELKEGNIDEAAAWGGVGTAGGSVTETGRRVSSSQQVTPVVAKKKLPVGVIDELYHLPAPVTPMPLYDDMNTPLLKNALRNYGVKPLAKKKARLKLKEIYHHTHQVLEDSDTETDSSDQAHFKLPQHASRKASSGKTASRKAPSRKAPSEKGHSGKDHSGEASTARASSAKAASRKKARSTTKIQLKPGCLDKMEEDGILQHDLQPKSKRKPDSADCDDSSDNSSESNNSQDSLEGRDDDEDEEEEIEPSQTTCVNMQEGLKNYIKSNDKLYETILQYVPLDIDAFHLELKIAGIKFSKSKLKEFLDHQGISFHTTNRGVRKARKPKRK